MAIQANRMILELFKNITYSARIPAYEFVILIEPGVYIPTHFLKEEPELLKPYQEYLKLLYGRAL